MENKTYDLRIIEALADSFLDCFNRDGEVLLGIRGLGRVFELAQKLSKSIQRLDSAPSQWVADALEISGTVHAKAATLEDIVKALEDTKALAKSILGIPVHGWECHTTCQAQCKCGLPCGDHYKSQEDEDGNEIEGVPPIPAREKHRFSTCEGLDVSSK